MFNFPDSPTVGTVFGNYTWDGEKWTVSAGGAPPATVPPLMDSVAAVGTATPYAREDHVHPSDTSRAALASPTFTGTPIVPTASVGTNTTQAASTGYVLANAATVAPLMNGSAAVGVATKHAREDHVHASDTSRAPLAAPVFTGNAQAVTPTAGDNSTSIATTAFVTAAITLLPMSLLARGCPPGGRLSFASGSSVMLSNVTGGNTVYYLPHNSGVIPLYDGTSWSLADISAGVSQLTTDATKSPAAVAATSLYDLFVWNDAGTIRLSRGPLWTNASTRNLTITRQNGILINTSNITNGPLAARGTWVGTFVSNGTSLADWIRGSNGASGAGQASLNLWNAYNRVDVKTVVGDTTASWTYALATWRAANNATNRVSLILGSADDDVEAIYSVGTENSTTSPSFAWAGIGIDSTTVLSGFAHAGVSAATGTVQYYGTAIGNYRGKLAVGTHVINAIESSPQVVSSLFFGVSGGNQSMGLSVNLKM